MLPMNALLVILYLASTFLIPDAFANVFARYQSGRSRRLTRSASLKDSAITKNITKPDALHRLNTRIEWQLKKRACPMSPYAIYLTDEQQEVLFELITEARKAGADESTVKQHINKYLEQILTPRELNEFHKANERFERERHGKQTSEGSDIWTWSSAHSRISTQRYKTIPQKFVVDGGQDISEILGHRDRLML